MLLEEAGTYQLMSKLHLANPVSAFEESCDFEFSAEGESPHA
jgi:hypothetical protein